jgi:protocatechuate 3,4-dioxygenase beta subunit
MNRSDITEGKTGVPLTLKLTILNTKDSCGPIRNAAVYIWHCDKDGAYSGYSQPGSNTVGQTFLRGILVTDSNGEVTFQTIYPGWYAGRITHIHFQVYLNDNLNVTATATSQLAFPQAITQAVYASSLYTARGQNTSVTSFSQDNVFSDGTTYQMATVTGDVNSGYVASLVVGIAAS